jgi:hypothetical protein
MTRAITTTIGALAATVMLSFPALAYTPQVRAPMQQTTFKTELTQTGPLATPGAITGKLTISISADGVVQGWYQPDDDPGFVLVTGGLDNGKLWLNIGEESRLHIIADVGADGSLSGSGFESELRTSALGLARAPATFAFDATPLS